EGRLVVEEGAIVRDQDPEVVYGAAVGGGVAAEGALVQRDRAEGDKRAARGGSRVVEERAGIHRQRFAVGDGPGVAGRMAVHERQVGQRYRERGAGAVVEVEQPRRTAAAEGDAAGGARAGDAQGPGDGKFAGG